MKLDGEFVFEASVQDVWDALFDPQVLAAVMPGCEKLELVDGSYLGELKVKVGPIQGKFTGKVDLLDLVEPTSYKMIVDGRGAQGFVKATATIVLEAVGDKTRIRYDSEAQVGGKIASVGQRLVETSARAIVKQSLDGLHDNIKIRADAYRAHHTASKPDATPAAEPAALVESAPALAVAESAHEATKPAAEAAHEATKPTAEPAPATKPAVPTVPAAETANGTVKPAAEPASALEAVPKPAAPVIEYKRADPAKLAGAVAKEVTKTLAPIIILVALVLAALIYVLVR